MQMEPSNTTQDMYQDVSCKYLDFIITESFAPVASDSGIRIVIGILLYYFHMFPRDE
jgi:hypothetical protein